MLLSKIKFELDWDFSMLIINLFYNGRKKWTNFLVLSGTAFVCDHEVGVVADPDDCRGFYICDFEHYEHFQCSPGYLFDPDLLVCNYAYEVDCGDRPIPGVSTTTSASTESTTTASTTIASTTTASTTSSTTASTTTASTTTASTTTVSTTTASTTTASTTTTTGNFADTVFPHIVSAETVLFWIWKSKGHST